MECIRSQAFLVVRCQTVGLHLYPMSSERFGFVVFDGLPFLLCSRIRAVLTVGLLQ